MTIYVVAIFISTFTAAIFDYLKIKKAFFIQVILIVLPFIVVAGLRSKFVGNDVWSYIWPNYGNGLNFHHFFEFNKYIKETTNTEIGFNLVTYLAIRLNIGFQIFLGLLEALIVVPLVYAMKVFSRKYNIPCFFQVFIFGCMFFDHTLNLVRQSIAIAFVVLMMAFLLEKNRVTWTALISFLVAFSFHRTSLVILPIIIIFYWFKTAEDPHQRLRRFIVLNVVTSSAVLFLSTYGFDMIGNLFSDKYSSYVNGSNWLASNSYSLRRVIAVTVIPLLYVVTVIVIRKSKFTALDALLSSLLVLDLVTNLTAVSGMVIYRLGLYFSAFEMLSVPFYTNKIFRTGKLTVYFVLGILYFSVFVYLVLGGEDGIYPFIHY